MTLREAPASRIDDSEHLSAGIFNVDGVLFASPDERTWREALHGIAKENRVTTAIYQSQGAGKPRLSGALAALRALCVPDTERQAAAYAKRKQSRLEALIHAEAFTAFPGALRFVKAVTALGWPIAAASSSKNANAMMRRIRLDAGRSLLNVLSANVCGRDLQGSAIQQSH